MVRGISIEDKTSLTIGIRQNGEVIKRSFNSLEASPHLSDKALNHRIAKYREPTSQTPSENQHASDNLNVSQYFHM